MNGSNWTDQEVYPVDKMYEVDTVKLIQYCRWFATKNMLRANDLTRDEVLRAEDKGRAEAYESIANLVIWDQLITKG